MLVGYSWIPAFAPIVDGIIDAAVPRHNLMRSKNSSISLFPSRTNGIDKAVGGDGMKGPSAWRDTIVGFEEIAIDLVEPRFGPVSVLATIYQAKQNLFSE